MTIFLKTIRVKILTICKDNQRHKVQGLNDLRTWKY